MRRLQAIYSLIPRSKTLADVGCDHGYISKHVLDAKLADRVIATDISTKCLQKAKKLLSGYSSIEFICTDGLDGVDADTVVIAGLGGFTIIDILQKKLAQVSTTQKLFEARLVLQPQDHCGELRQFLTNNGFKIIQDIVASENGKYYDVLLAIRGNQILDRYQIELGAFYNSDVKDDNCNSQIAMLTTESRLLLQERLQRDYDKFCGYNDGGKNADKRDFLREALRILASKSNHK